MKFVIKLYETYSGREVVSEFIESLQPKTKAKLIRQLELLEEFGKQLGMPHAKPIGRGLFELRVRGKQEVRVIYAYTKKDTAYLLHAFLKKTQAIPRRELNIALKRKKEIDNI